jgi:glycerophosphoryl diester phosphodiesterase
VNVNQRRIGVNELTLSDLAAAVSVGNRPRVPKLKEVLDRLRDTQTLLLLDIKSSGVIDEIIRLVSEANVVHKTLIASFDYLPLARVKERHPMIQTIVTVGLSRVMTRPLGLLWTLFALFFPLRAAIWIRANVILCPAYRLTRQLVRRAHEREIAVFAWKLGDQPERSLAPYNIDGVVIGSFAMLSRGQSI